MSIIQLCLQTESSRLVLFKLHVYHSICSQTESSKMTFFKLHVYHSILFTNWKFKNGFIAPICTEVAYIFFIEPPFYKGACKSVSLLDNSRDCKMQHDYIIIYLPRFHSSSTCFRVHRYSYRVKRINLRS